MSIGKFLGLLVINFIIFLVAGTVLDNLGFNVISGQGFNLLVLASITLFGFSLFVCNKKCQKCIKK